MSTFDASALNAILGVATDTKQTSVTDNTIIQSTENEIIEKEFNVITEINLKSKTQDELHIVKKQSVSDYFNKKIKVSMETSDKDVEDRPVLGSVSVVKKKKEKKEKSKKSKSKKEK